MSRYDGLIIPRSYSEYLNKTDSATLSQMLQHLTGLWSHAVSAGDQKPVTSNAVYESLTDAATIQQALQVPGVLSGAVAAGDNKAVKSSAVYEALANYTVNGSSPTFQDVTINGTLNLNVTHTDEYIDTGSRAPKVYFLVVWNDTTNCCYLVNKKDKSHITLTKLFGDAYVSTNDYNVWFNVPAGTPNPCDYIMF